MTTQADNKGKSSSGSGKVFLIGAAVILVGLVALNVMRQVPAEGARAELSVPEGRAREALTDDELRALAPVIEAAWALKELPAGTYSEKLNGHAEAAFAASRDDGRRTGNHWETGQSGVAALYNAVRSLREQLPANLVSTTDVLEIDLAHSFETVDPRRQRGKLSNVERGLKGIEVIHAGKVNRFAPTTNLANNRDFNRVLEVFERQHKLPRGAVNRPDVTVRLFSADQLLARLGPDGVEVVPMYRGNQIVPIEDITKPAVKHLADAHSDWLFNNLQPDGRETYLFWPSRGDEAPPSKNNMIRQWMATVAMGRVAQDRGDEALFARVEQNIAYNLDHFFKKEGEYGLIEWNGKVKLGALALATLSIVEHPSRAKFKDYETAMIRTMDSLWHEDGSFTTFFKPRGRSDNENFYPGEALLLYATLYEESRDPALLAKIMKSLAFYKEWHLAHRNPAFVPWHTQAYYKVWAITGDPVVRDWVFEMNDWLLGVQQWESTARYPDTMGRFYDPTRPFGPPHASATGVYLEGLIDAWRMAKASGDTERQETYRRGIMRGLRSVTQLTFLDDVDMFYSTKRERLRGGVRTTVYDNSIRVDNVQHNLMGILKILRFIPPEDFRP